MPRGTGAYGRWKEHRRAVVEHRARDRERYRLHPTVASPIVATGVLVCHTAFALPGCNDFGAPSELLPSVTLVVGLTMLLAGAGVLVWTQGRHFHAVVRLTLMLLCLYPVVGLVGLVWFAKLALHPVMDDRWWVPGTALLGGLFVVALVTYLRHRRRPLNVESRQACIGCRYDMSGLPEAAQCPECGRPYDRMAAVEFWRGGAM